MNLVVPITTRLIKRCQETSKVVKPLEYRDSVNELLNYIDELTTAYKKQIVSLEEQNGLKDRLISIYEKAIYGEANTGPPNYTGK